MKENLQNRRLQRKTKVLDAGRVLAIALCACAWLCGCQSGGEAPAGGGMAAQTGSAQSAASGAPSYAADVAPILNQKCVSCHGRLLPQKGLKLHTREAIFQGGESGVAVVPGRPQQSPLYTALKLPPADPRHMPPVAGGQVLSAAEIATIREWIEAGAP